MKHTPGPWQADSKKLVIRRGQGSKMGFVREAREDCYIVETANGGHRHIAFVRNRIDARLIAAAPEMYKSLKEFMYAANPTRYLSRLLDDAYVKADALLRRIEGEEDEE